MTVLSFGLLFLPAAGDRSPDGVEYVGWRTRYYSITAGPANAPNPCGLAIDFQPKPMYFGGWCQRAWELAIRLASRQVCPVCCLSVMFRHSKYSEECVVLGCSVPARCGA